MHYRYTPVPDTLIARAVSSTESTNTLDPREQRYGGFETPAGMSTPSTEIEMVKIGQARNTLMNMRLTQVNQIANDFISLSIFLFRFLIVLLVKLLLIQKVI